MKRERTSVGLDVHARSVVACGIDEDTGELFTSRLAPDPEAVFGWLRQLPEPVAVVYEAGPTGFGLARFLRARQDRCLVAAPSKMQRPSGDRVKTDARDALLLARLLRLGEIVEVTVPTLAQEAARDLVRAREDVRGDLMRSGTAPPSCCCVRGSSTRAGPPGRARITTGCAGSTSTAPLWRSPTTARWRPCCSLPIAGTAWTGPSSSWPRTPPGHRR